MDGLQPPTNEAIASTVRAASSRAGLDFTDLATATHIDQTTLRRRMADGGSFLLPELRAIAGACGTTLVGLLTEASTT